MKCCFPFVALTALLFSFSVFSALTQEQSTPFTTDLIADGGSPSTQIDVGDVIVWNDATTLYVRYLIADPTPSDPRDNWCIGLTHLHVATSAFGIPQTITGNPKVGKFAYQTTHTPCVTDFTYQVPLSWSVGKKLYIAAQAEVRTQFYGLPGLTEILPSSATISVTYPVAGGTSYFPALTVSNDTFLNGPYGGWCVDTDHTIPQNFPLTANIYSSYETLPAGLVENPQNLDLVNWVLNQHYVGKTSPGEFGAYTYGDVQLAIWTLIEDQTSTSGLGAYSQDRVNEIVAGAQALGEGFVPGCNEVVALIFDPRLYTGDLQQVIIGQVVVAELGVACEKREETAWGMGHEFRGNNWAEYLNYNVQ